MDKMQIYPVDHRSELIEFIKDLFLCTPIKLSSPIIYELREICSVSPIGPVGARNLVWKTGSPETIVEIVQYLFGNPHIERANDVRLNL
jgi:hypothetical protein